MQRENPEAQALPFLSPRSEGAFINRTFSLDSAEKMHKGWLRMGFDETRSQLVLSVSDSLREVLQLVTRRVRATFDFDADPNAINHVLHASFPAADSLRVPGMLAGPAWKPWRSYAVIWVWSSAWIGAEP